MFKRVLHRLFPNPHIQQSEFNKVKSELEATKFLLGQFLAKSLSTATIAESEYKVFSQWGEDGIIQFLIRNLNIQHKIFIEFGVESYRESNTRFLLMNDNWKGLVIDGSAAHVDDIKNQEIYWKYELTAAAQFITKENINSIFTKNGFQGEIGLLSIDIDGNDYWVWQAIESVNPAIIVAEYNSVFGKERAVTVPYDASFYRTNKHFSNLYFGASLKALTLLANKKGYDLVGCNSNGNNCFFVRKDLLNEKVKAKSVEAAFVESHFRESRNSNGQLTFISGKDRIAVIGDMKVYDVESEKEVLLKDLY